MFKNYSLLIFLLSFLYIFTNCKKEEQSYPEPLVSLSSPLHYQSYNVYDTILIQGKITCSRNISKISLSVTGKDLKPVISGSTIDVNSTEYMINTFLVIDNRYIEEPLNYLLLKVEDDDKTYNYWFTININPLTKALSELLVVTGSGNTNNLYRINLNGVSQQVLNWNSEYLGGYGDSKNRMFYTSGALVDGLRGYNLLTNQTDWTIGTLSGSLPYFSVFSATVGKATVALDDGVIESFNSSGMIICTTPKKKSGKFTEILNLEKHIVSAFKKYGDQSGAILIYNYPSGSVYDSIYYSADKVHFIRQDSDNILILLHEGDLNKAYTYNLSNKRFNFLHVVASDTINMISGDSDNIFLATPNKILWYKPAIGSCVDLINASGINAIAYDSVSMIIYVGIENRIEKYSFPYGLLVGSTSFSSKVKDIDLIYNK